MVSNILVPLPSSCLDRTGLLDRRESQGSDLIPPLRGSFTVLFANFDTSASNVRRDLFP